MTKQVRDWQFDTQLCSKVKEIGHTDVSADIVTDIAIYWLQQYAAEKERADKLQAELSEYTEAHWKAFEQEKKLREARPIDEWGEDYGDVLWWTFPIEEPPYCGNPFCSDWPGYHTHWTPFVVPDKEEEAK